MKLPTLSQGIDRLADSFSQANGSLYPLQFGCDQVCLQNCQTACQIEPIFRRPYCLRLCRQECCTF